MKMDVILGSILNSIVDNTVKPFPTRFTPGSSHGGARSKEVFKFFNLATPVLMAANQTSIADISKSGLSISKDTTIDVTLIVASALIRIADSQELIAQNYIKMMTDLENYRKAYSDKKDEVAQLERTNHALKGHITRLKNKK